MNHPQILLVIDPEDTTIPNTAYGPFYTDDGVNAAIDLIQSWGDKRWKFHIEPLMPMESLVITHGRIERETRKVF